jgi:MFS family permease
MLLTVLPYAIGWALIVWAQNFMMMLFGRLILGIAGGAFSIASPLYTSEIAEKEIRGALGTFFQISSVGGILFAYVVGDYTSIYVFNIICGVLPLIFGIIFVFMPETPYYLISKNKEDACVKSLQWLRGKGYDVQTEVNEIKAGIEKQRNEHGSFRKALTRRSTIKALIIAVVCVIIRPLSGINVIVAYAAEIFEVCIIY